MSPKRTSPTAACLVVSLLALSCSNPTEPGPRIPPRALSSQEASLVEADNLFGLNLLRAVAAAEEEPNLFLSPLSVAMALGMTLNGADGDTRLAMEDALELVGLTEEEINDAYRSLIELLTGMDPKVTMQIANSIWYREGFPVADDFTELNRTYFDALVRALDFALPDAVQTINDWVNEKTSGKIESILDSIPAEVVMYLINAVYFKGTWTCRFKESDTQPADFHLADGAVKEVPMMRIGDVSFPYYADDDVQAVELAYGDSLYAMTIVLPREGVDVNALVAGLDRTKWEGWLSGMEMDYFVHLSMPKYRLEYENELSDELAALGMGIAFDPDLADFSRMVEPGAVLPGNLFITRVLHKTFVEVNEKGTEAAAVTAVEVGLTSVPSGISMEVNRPFLFAIRERHSGTLLFLGLMGDPPVS